MALGIMAMGGAFGLLVLLNLQPSYLSLAVWVIVLHFLSIFFLSSRRIRNRPVPTVMPTARFT
jgi:hypothetical protein